MWTSNNLYGVSDLYIADKWRNQDGLYVRDGYVVRVKGHSDDLNEMPQFAFTPYGNESVTLHLIHTVPTTNMFNEYIERDDCTDVVRTMLGGTARKRRA
jgi:hypothetical protein